MKKIFRPVLLAGALALVFTACKKEAKETETGISIHFVNENFDEGEIIHQSRFKIEPGDSLDILKFKGQQLEHLHYPKVIESLLKRL